MNRNKGITLISLVVTIIILIILSGVTIAQITGNGLFTKSKQAKNEAEKSEATEAMNLKITNLQIWSYAENTRMPTLQELADGFCQDNEFEYVKKGKEKVASFILPQINTSNLNSIFVKLKKYPYEFEIDESLKLASIDGVKVSDTNSGVSTEQYEELLSKITAIEANQKNGEEKILALESELEKTKSDLKISNEKIETLENETIVNKRINLMNTERYIPVSTTLAENLADIILSDSIENYKYLEIQADIYWTKATEAGNDQEKTIFIAVEQLNYNSTDTVNWKNESTFNIDCSYRYNNIDYVSVTGWFKNNKTLHIGYSQTGRTDWSSIRIRNIYGIK